MFWGVSSHRYQHWPWGGCRPTCGKRGLLNICVYPRAKTNRLYLPQSNIPNTESEEKKDAVSAFWEACSEFTQTEKTRTWQKTAQIYSLNAKILWTFILKTVILWFIPFPENKAQIGKQHLEEMWPLREWEHRSEEAWLIDQLPT